MKNRYLVCNNWLKTHKTCFPIRVFENGSLAFVSEKDIKKRNIARNRKLDSIFSEVLKSPELDGGNQYD